MLLKVGRQLQCRARVDSVDVGERGLQTFGYAAEARAAQAQLVSAVLPAVRDIRRAGAAALDLAWVAAGRLDAYFEHGVKPWDIAAGVLLCAAAGQHVEQLPAGGGLPAGVLAASPAIAPELLALVRR